MQVPGEVNSAKQVRRLATPDAGEIQTRRDSGREELLRAPSAGLRADARAGPYRRDPDCFSRRTPVTASRPRSRPPMFRKQPQRARPAACTDARTKKGRTRIPSPRSAANAERRHERHLPHADPLDSPPRPGSPWWRRRTFPVRLRWVVASGHLDRNPARPAADREPTSLTLPARAINASAQAGIRIAADRRLPWRRAVAAVRPGRRQPANR